jgi:HEPN domain-containing protein
MKDDTDDDEDGRTQPLGLFNVAEAYWHAAKALQNTKRKTPHSNSPIWFLYYHSIELYLKAFLRAHGHTAKQLRLKYSHDMGRIQKRAEKLGLFFEDEDLEVLHIMATTDAVIRSRYHKTGYFSWPTHDALNRTCKSLRQSVGEELKKDGIPVHI